MTKTVSHASCIPASPARRGGCWALALMAGTLAGQATASAYDIGDTGVGSGFKVKAQSIRSSIGHQVHWTRPALEVGWGFAPGLEATLGSGYGMADGYGGHRRHGSHDMKLALKWQLPDVLPAALQWAVEPEILLPTGSRAAGMGGAGTGASLPLRASRALGRMLATGQLAWVKPPGEDAGWSAGALLEYEAAPALWLGVEMLHDAPGTTPAFQRASLGFRWERSTRLLVFGALGRSWRTPAEDAERSVRIGVEYAFE